MQSYAAQGRRASLLKEVVAGLNSEILALRARQREILALPPDEEVFLPWGDQYGDLNVYDINNASNADFHFNSVSPSATASGIGMDARKVGGKNNVLNRRS